MAGHSKWSNTKYRKAAQDAKRGKIFTKIIRELVTATKLGGNDINSNPRLRVAIDKALSNNMTRDTLNRAIARGMGNDDNTQMKTIIYEGYGPGGTAIIVKCLSNNRNRTTSEIRYAFTKVGGNLGTDGSVSYLFTKLGVISFKSELCEDTVINTAIESGANDIITYGNGTIDVFTTFNTLNKIKNTLKAAGLVPETYGIAMIPSIRVNLDTETRYKLLYLIDILENCNDVQEIYHNGEISGKIVANL